MRFKELRFRGLNDVAEIGQIGDAFLDDRGTKNSRRTVIARDGEALIDHIGNPAYDEADASAIFRIDHDVHGIGGGGVRVTPALKIVGDLNEGHDLAPVLHHGAI